MVRYTYTFARRELSDSSESSYNSQTFKGTHTHTSGNGCDNDNATDNASGEHGNEDGSEDRRWCATSTEKSESDDADELIMLRPTIIVTTNPKGLSAQH